MRINENLKKVILFICLFFNLFCVAYGQSLKREQDGFKWFRGTKGLYVCDKDGNIIVPEDDYVQLDKEGDYFIADKMYSTMRVYNQYGKMLAETNYDLNKFNIIGNKIISEKNAYNAVLCIIDSEGKRIIPYKKYKNIKIIDNGYCYAVQSHDGYWGLADSLGSEYIPTEYTNLDYIGGDFVKFKIGDYWGVMKFDGTTIIPTSRGYTSIGRYARSQNVIPFEKNGVNGECDSTGKELTIIGGKKVQSSKNPSKKTTAKPTTTQSTSTKNTTSSKTSSPKINPIFTNLHGEESYELLYVVRGYTKNNGTISVKEKEWGKFDKKKLDVFGVKLKLDNHVLSSTSSLSSTLFSDGNEFFPKITLTGKPILNSKGTYEYPYKCGNYEGKALLRPDKEGNLLFTYVSEVNSGIEKRYIICIKK